jgi:hypothetical protein
MNRAVFGIDSDDRFVLSLSHCRINGSQRVDGVSWSMTELSLPSPGAYRCIRISRDFLGFDFMLRGFKSQICNLVASIFRRSEMLGDVLISLMAECRWSAHPFFLKEDRNTCLISDTAFWNSFSKRFPGKTHVPAWVFCCVPQRLKHF